jgi:hypothetical protein
MVTVLAVVASAGEIRREMAGLVARIIETSGESNWPRLELTRRDGGTPERIELDRTRSVHDILFVSQRRLLVLGELGSRGDIVSVVDTESAKVIDVFWGRRASVSPDLTTVAFEYRVPPAAGVEIHAGLVAYDLTLSPKENRPLGSTQDTPDERGIVLYPERHRVAQRSWFLREEGDPRRQFDSPIAWATDSKRLAIVAQEERDHRLVVIDISRGLRQPSISEIPIAREPFLDTRLANATPARIRTETLTFKELRFSEDGGSVSLVPWPAGPFAGKAVTLAIPAAGR